MPIYGYVWYPRVTVGWRPYHHGRWSFAARSAGSGSASIVWAWPTHHYGRWGYGSNRWFWIPGRRWAPAWVSWAYAPGYVELVPARVRQPSGDCDSATCFGRTRGRAGRSCRDAVVRAEHPRRAPRGVVARRSRPGLVAVHGAPERARRAAPDSWPARNRCARRPRYAVPRGSSSGGPAFDGGGGAAFATAGSSPGQSSIAASPVAAAHSSPQSRAGGIDFRRRTARRR